MSIWAHIDRLIDSAPTPAGLRAHGIHLLAARRWRALGQPIPPDFLADERAAATAALAAQVLTARVRSVLTGPIALIKGPEVAARYPAPGLRPYSDIDLLVPDADEAQRTLLAAGFEELWDQDDHLETYHLPPLRWPGLPLLVEVHSSVWWPRWARTPATAELLAAAIPSATAARGIMALPPAQHAVLLATHSWLHLPLRRLLDLIDVAVMAEGIDRADLDAQARAWGVDRLWTTTMRAIDAVLLGGATRSWPSRVWARHLAPPRDRLVVERILAMWLGPFWAQPTKAALRSGQARLLRDLQPEAGESWLAFLTHKGRTVRDALTPVLEYERRHSALGNEWGSRSSERSP